MKIHLVCSNTVANQSIFGFLLVLQQFIPLNLKSNLIELNTVQDCLEIWTKVLEMSKIPIKRELNRFKPSAEVFLTNSANDF